MKLLEFRYVRESREGGGSYEEGIYLTHPWPLPIFNQSAPQKVVW